MLTILKLLVVPFVPLEGGDLLFLGVWEFPLPLSSIIGVLEILFVSFALLALLLLCLLFVFLREAGVDPFAFADLGLGVLGDGPVKLRLIN